MIAEKIHQEILVIELPAMRVAAYRAVSEFPEIEANTVIKETIRKMNLNFHGLRKFGVDIAVSDEELKRGLRSYEAWVSIPDKISFIEGVYIKKIPAGLYASCKVINPSKTTFDNISNGWIELHNWVKRSNYKSCLSNPNRYMIEEYVREKGKIFLQLYYPVSVL